MRAAPALLLLPLALCAGTVACAPGEPSVVGPAPPEPRIAVSGAWTVAHRDPDGLALRLGDTGHGVRVTLAPDGRGRVPGVTPIEGGRALQTVRGGRVWPLVAVGYPDRPLSHVDVTSEGLDLVVRFAGPPLRELTVHPDAPADPALTWVRLRPRGASWRIVVDGLATVTVPGPATAAPGPRSGWTVSADGAFQVDTEAPGWRGANAEGWILETQPSLDLAQPYPRTSMTWWPDKPRDRNLVPIRINPSRPPP